MAVKSYLIILLVTNQSDISFSAARGLSFIDQERILFKKSLQKQLRHTFLEFYINQEKRLLTALLLES